MRWKQVGPLALLTLLLVSPTPAMNLANLPVYLAKGWQWCGDRIAFGANGLYLMGLDGGMRLTHPRTGGLAGFRRTFPFFRRTELSLFLHPRDRGATAEMVSDEFLAKMADTFELLETFHPFGGKLVRIARQAIRSLQTRSPSLSVAESHAYLMAVGLNERYQEVDLGRIDEAETLGELRLLFLAMPQVREFLLGLDSGDVERDRTIRLMTEALYTEDRLRVMLGRRFYSASDLEDSRETIERYETYRARESRGQTSDSNLNDPSVNVRTEIYRLIVDDKSGRPAKPAAAARNAMGRNVLSHPIGRRQWNDLA